MGKQRAEENVQLLELLDAMDNRKNALWLVEACRTKTEFDLCKLLMGFGVDNYSGAADFWANQLLQRLISRLESHITQLEDHLLQDMSECEKAIEAIKVDVNGIHWYETFNVGGTD